MQELSEIENVINTRVLTEQSKTTYRNTYKKLYSVFGRPIHITKQHDLLIAIDEISNNKISNKLSFINIAILINKFYNVPYDMFDEFRETLVIERDKQNQLPKQLDLPEFKDVKKYVNELTGLKYIVNYLIFTYGVRNKDVNVFITNRKNTKNIDNNTNYLLVKNKEIEWIRNDYKTVASHLQQKIIIRAKKFIEICQSLELETWLLSGTNEPIAPTSLNNTVTRMLYKHNDKHLTEGDYFKLNVKHLQTQKNSYTKIISLGNIRGTDPATIESYYNLSK